MKKLEPVLSCKPGGITEQAISWLCKLIAIPSFSREEHGTADLLRAILTELGYEPFRIKNNVGARSRNWQEGNPVLMLCSHHDTVKPNGGYTVDPFSAKICSGKLIGLGSNDAGASLVSLLAAFTQLDKPNLGINLLYLAVAEEEISGANGITAILPELGPVDMAIVGEPTNMQLATSEKGLLVVDVFHEGISGHAARNEGENAIYKALKDIDWFKNYEFPKSDPALGKVHMHVTMIQAGTQHNVIPDVCKFTVDIRTCPPYSNEEILEVIQQNVEGTAQARSLRLQPTGISMNHPLVKAGVHLGIQPFGSPTLSDQALLQMPSVKIGPGDSRRSHTADEYIFLEEIEEGITIYIQYIQQLAHELSQH